MITWLLLFLQLFPFPSARSTGGGGGGGSDTPYLTAVQGGTPRNDFNGDVGFQFTVGASNITVTQVGRWVISGNSATHVVTITRDSDQVDVAHATVVTSGATAGAFAYTTLGSPVTLTAGATYYCTSQEVTGGDSWYNIGSVGHTTAATISAAKYRATGDIWNTTGSADSAFSDPTFVSHP